MVMVLFRKEQSLKDLLILDGINNLKVIRQDV